MAFLAPVVTPLATAAAATPALLAPLGATLTTGAVAASGVAAGGISLGTILSGVGSLVSAAGSIQQGQAAQQQANLQAEILRREAERERLVSQGEASEFARDTRRLLARQRALMGARGVQIGTGTPLELATDTAEEAEFQRLKILSGGEATVSRLLSQAGLARASGRAARRQGFLRGAASAFGPVKGRTRQTPALFSSRESLLLRGSGQRFGQAT